MYDKDIHLEGDKLLEGAGESEPNALASSETGCEDAGAALLSKLREDNDALSRMLMKRRKKEATGPVTKQGKSVSSRNSYKTGAYATKIVPEYFVEVRGSSLAWISHPRRMLRHKALVQCARLAFAMTGVYDQDEVHRISEAKRSKLPTKKTSGNNDGRFKAGMPLGVDAVKRHLGLRAA